MVMLFYANEYIYIAVNVNFIFFVVLGYGGKP